MTSKNWFQGMCAAMLVAAGGVLWNSATQAVGADAADPFGGKHVLVIGIDGCRSDALQAAKKPNMKALIDNGTVCYRAYSGGTVGTKTEQRLKSGPAWSSILTGVWIDKHGVAKNGFTDANFFKIVDGKNVAYPSFFWRIREKFPKAYLASIVHWKPINDCIVFDVDHEDSGNDAEVAQKCADLLLSDLNPSVIFLQFDEVDGAGHGKGYGPQSPEYMKAIETVDQHVGTCLDAMRKRPNFTKEDWLVLVTADHGGLEKKHGDQTPEERTVFLIASGSGYPHKVVDAPWGIVAIPPTVFQHLGIPVDTAWGWESPAFK
jgi:predicted AlkP superfamily pyrophosphatase or phosphodiesterase